MPAQICLLQQRNPLRAVRYRAGIQFALRTGPVRLSAHNVTHNAGSQLSRNSLNSHGSLPDVVFRQTAQIQHLVAHEPHESV